MSIERQLAAIRDAMERAKQSQLDIHASEELGAVKREVRAFLSGQAVLADLFPSRVFGDDDHQSTDALVGALERARERLRVLADGAARRRGEAQALIHRATLLSAAKADKAAEKLTAIALLSTHFTAAYERNVSWARRQLRTEHAPSTVIVAALREALTSARDGPHASTLERLVGVLDALARRTELKREINAFLSSISGGELDLRPRSLVRVDHTSTAALLKVLSQLERDYAVLADAERQAAQLATIEALIARLRRRRALKDERDACLLRARALKNELKAADEAVRALVEQIEAELTAHVRKSDELAEKTAAAARKRRAAELLLSQAERQLELLTLCAEALDDELPLPDSLDQLDARVLALEADVARALPQLTEANAALARERELYEAKHVEALAAGAGQVLPSPRALDAAQRSAEQLEGTLARARLELDVLRATSRRGDLLVELAAALGAKAEALRSEAEKGAVAVEDKRRALAAADDALAQLQADSTAHELSFRGALEVRRLCLEQREAIAGALSRYRELHRDYRRTDALVFYIRSTADLYARLQRIGTLLVGRRNAVDAMGSVRIALMIDAGVRTGVELGILELTAEVRLTLLLEGTLSVLDSREVCFESHLGVFLSAQAHASAGLEPTAEALGAGDILAIPDVLLKAAAKCRATLHDQRACTVYASPDDWAAHWAHVVAKRQAFLKSAELTPSGYAQIDEAWLGQQVRALAQAPGGLAFLSKLDGALTRPPRVLSLSATDRVRASAEASAGEHRVTVGHHGGTARFALSLEALDGEHEVGAVLEHCLEFVPEKTKRTDAEGSSAAKSADVPAPSGFVGSTVYHELTVGAARPRASTLPRAFVEVTMLDAHALTLGSFSFDSASSSLPEPVAPGPALVARHRALATSLGAEPAASFDRAVALPPALEAALTARPHTESGAFENPALRFARTVRMRLDLVVARGDPTRLTRLLASARNFEADAEERLAAAAEKAEQTEAMAARLGALLRGEGEDAAALPALMRGALVARGAGLAPVADGVGALAALAKDKASLVAEGLAAQLAELRECVTLLDNSHAAYARYVRSYRATLSDGALSWGPTWVAQVHRGLCRRRFSASCELSISVVPLVKVFVGASVEFVAQSSEFEALGLETFSYAKSLATAMPTDKWHAWWGLHGDELIELCRAVTRPGSVPFSEVALDALEGRSALREPARAFGEVCFDAFRPYEENPFAARDFGEPRIVAALGGKLGRRSTSSGALPSVVAAAPPAAPAPSEAAEAALTYPLLASIRDALRTPWLDGPPAAPRSADVLLAAVLASLERVIALKRGVVQRYERAGVERGELSELNAQRQLGSARDAARSSEDALARRAAAVSTLDLGEGRRITAARALAGLLSERLAAHERLAMVLAGLLGEVTPMPFTGDVSRPTSAAMQGVARAASLLRAICPVPSFERWKQDSAVSFMLRSGATDELDRAVTAFHKAGPARAPAFDGRAPASFEGAIDLVDAHLVSFAAELRRAEFLRKAVGAWYGGRDESASRRAPAVAAVLELPLEAYVRRLLLGLTFLLLHRELALRLEERLTLEAGIAAFDARTARLRRAEELRSAFRQAVSTAVVSAKLHGAARAYRARQDPEGTSLAALKDRLADYLRAAAPDFAHDQLVHGRKVVLLRGEALPVYRVPEPVLDADEEAPSASAG